MARDKALDRALEQLRKPAGIANTKALRLLDRSRERRRTCLAITSAAHSSSRLRRYRSRRGHRDPGHIRFAAPHSLSGDREDRKAQVRGRSQPLVSVHFTNTPAQHFQHRRRDLVTPNQIIGSASATDRALRPSPSKQRRRQCQRRDLARRVRRIT